MNKPRSLTVLMPLAENAPRLKPALGANGAQVTS
jgi:hypothetical protein